MDGNDSCRNIPGKAKVQTSLQKVVFLFDLDNTLLDNDRAQDDLKKHLEHEFGVLTGDRYSVILEELCVELGYADYLGALQRYRIEYLWRPATADRTIGHIGDLVDYDLSALLSIT